ncbi:MAG TPA: CPBP family intramembrane glutamic endopeptidase [Myxococcota bacterium]|nr:CPBP family intramembrane glutamic endopeptidase [Myxococcota bacterium]
MAARVALACLVVAGAFAVAGALTTASHSLPTAIALSLSSVALEGILLAFAVAAALAAPGDPRVRLGLVRARLGVLEIAALAAGTLGLSHALDGLLSLSGLMEESGLASFSRILEGIRGPSLAAALVAFGLVPAVAEELLCRGVLQRSLRDRFGAFASIGLAAIAFAAIHVQPIHALFALPLGLYLGVAGHWSASVLAPVVCHAVNNLVAVGSAVAEGPTTSSSPGEVAVGLLVAAAALAWVARRRRGLQPTAGSVDG